MKHLLIAFMSVLIVVSCLTDIRPKTLTVQKQKEPHILLLQSAKHHGYNAWAALNSYSCIIRDSFPGPFGKMASPFEGSKGSFKASYFPKVNMGKMVFTSGKEKEKIWEYKDGIPYLNGESKKIKKKESKNIKFWVPTYQYFIEFPFRILEADALEYLGTESKNERTYRKILASWKTTQPQKDIDQYIIWLNEDNQIDYIEYTVRDQNTILKGSAHYLKYKKVNGVLFPESVDFYSNLTGKNILHHMEIRDIKIPSE